MKYTNTVEINKPRAEVIQLFDDPKNMKYWMDGLQDYKHLKGEPGTEGAKTKLWINQGKRQMEMVETITTHNPPKEFHGIYETTGAWNGQKNFFTELNENRTLWTSENEFKFEGFLMKAIGFLMPGAFKKQTQKYMESFKAFAEKS